MERDLFTETLETWKQPVSPVLSFYRRNDMIQAVCGLSVVRLKTTISRVALDLNTQDKSFPRILDLSLKFHVFIMNSSQSDMAKTKWKYTLKRKNFNCPHKIIPISHITLLKQLIKVISLHIV